MILATDIEDGVLALDAEAAGFAASLAVAQRRTGRAGAVPDLLIAGIALAAGATLTARNVRHFADLPVRVVDP